MAPSLRSLLPRALPGGDEKAKLGTGQVPGNSFNNAGFLALFAILGGTMVLAAIYFFFIAKNGGFKRITKDDWEDYKSTVLRRKGPDGKTLSNATKSTKLGGGSVVPKWAKSEYTRSTESSYDNQEMREAEEGRRHRETRQTSRHDPELAAYKHEKAAKVGGINTSMHGSQWDHSNTDRSDVTPQPASKKEAKKAEKERKAKERAEQKEAERKEKAQRKARKEVTNKKDNYSDSEAPPQQRRSQPSAAYSFRQGDDAESSIYTATNTDTQTRYTQPSIRQVSYYDSYRPHSTHLPPVREQPTPPSSYHSGTNREGTRSHRSSRESMNHPSRQGSPRKQPRSSRSDYTATTDTGTKVYEHHIPGLSKGEVGIDDSVSQVGARRYQQHRTQPPASNSSGYRRGGGRGRGDSLSESEM
jgi:hypothetical protein